MKEMVARCTHGFGELEVRTTYGLGSDKLYLRIRSTHGWGAVVLSKADEARLRRKLNTRAARRKGRR